MIVGIWLCKGCYAQTPMSSGKPAEPCPTCGSMIYIGIRQMQPTAEVFHISEIEFKPK